MASLFCHSFSTVELCELIVGGSLKIIQFPIMKKRFKDSSFLHEKALTQYACAFFLPVPLRANMESKQICFVFRFGCPTKKYNRTGEADR